MGITIRRAVYEDAPFIAWVMLAASRSHLDYGAWEVYVGGTEKNCLRFLELTATTDTPHLFHYSIFIIAEDNDKPIAALSGYDPEEFGMPSFIRSLPGVYSKIGWSISDQEAAFKRFSSFFSCVPDDAEGAWIVESVGVLPESRQQGIVSRLLDEILDIGRNKGHKLAQIGVMIGNTPARMAYEKAGFRFVDEKRSPDFEAVYGSPGIARLIMNL